MFGNIISISDQTIIIENTKSESLLLSCFWCLFNLKSNTPKF